MHINRLRTQAESERDFLGRLAAREHSKDLDLPLGQQVLGCGLARCKQPLGDGGN